MSIESLAKSMVPKDKWNFVFIIFLINGIGTLFPWNMLINADNYFVNFKLNVTAPSEAVTDYRNHFLSYLGIASKAPNIFLQLLNLFINAEGANFSLRIIITLALQIGVFLFIIGTAAVNSTSWPGLFFWLTMGSAAAINTANGVYQGCIYGIASRFPGTYINAITIGMNLSGMIASVLMLISISVSHNSQMEAIVFFSFAVVLLAVCLVAEFFIIKSNFYQFYAHFKKTDQSAVEFREGEEPKETIEISVSELKPENLPPLSKYLFVIRCIWPQLLNILLIYIVSLSIFPAVAARIPSTDGLLNERYYSSVFCFLFFNVFVTVGSATAQFVQWPGPRWLVLPVLLRVAFIPFFLYCNYQPSDTLVRTVPVLFKHDWMYILGIVALSWSSGYLSSLTMIYAPKAVPKSLAATAGMLGALTIIVGILIGINTALIYPRLFSKS